jgi:anti-sigma-K factor RskA
MSDIHALSGAYAVDALDDTERAEFEKHLSECAACRAEVASFRSTSALLAETVAEAPPASLRDSVLAGISEVRPLPPSPAPDERSANARRGRWLPQLLAAAAAVVLLAAGVLAWHPWRHDSTTLADRILHAPDAVSMTEPLAHGGELTLVRSASLGRAVLVGHDVPSAPDGKTYQMWIQQPGEDMVPAGLMPAADRPTVLTGDATTAAAVAVSVEPDGGSAQPTSDPVVLFMLGPGSGNGAT